MCVFQEEGRGVGRRLGAGRRGLIATPLAYRCWKQKVCLPTLQSFASPTYATKGHRAHPQYPKPYNATPTSYHTFSPRNTLGGLGSLLSFPFCSLPIKGTGRDSEELRRRRKEGLPASSTGLPWLIVAPAAVVPEWTKQLRVWGHFAAYQLESGKDADVRNEGEQRGGQGVGRRGEEGRRRRNCSIQGEGGKEEELFHRKHVRRSCSEHVLGCCGHGTAILCTTVDL